MNNEAIVLGLVNRNKDAIGTFWSAYYDKVYPICAYILGANPDAHDMTVDILVDFIDNRARRLTSPGAMYAFLRQTAVRRSIRFKDRKNKQIYIDADDQISEKKSPEENADLNMLYPVLQSCLAELTPKAQAVLTMKYHKKISNERIGDFVGGSKSYIGRLLNNGLTQLRRCLETKVRKTVSENLGFDKTNRLPVRLITVSTVEALLTRRAMSVVDPCPDFDDVIQEGPVDEDDAHLKSRFLRRKSLLLRHRPEDEHDEAKIDFTPVWHTAAARRAN